MDQDVELRICPKGKGGAKKYIIRLGCKILRLLIQTRLEASRVEPKANGNQFPRKVKQYCAESSVETS